MSRRPPAALAMVALVIAGCSDTPAETPSTKKTASVKFAECMREHGVAGFPDPEGSEELTIDGVVNGSSLDPDGPAWKAAIRACKDLQPAGFTGHERTPAEQERALEFAECIRDNGVEDFPDPIDGAPPVDTNRIPSSATDAGMAVLNAAMRTCGDRLADSAGRR